MFKGLRARVRECFDPRCAHVDCGKSIGDDAISLPVTLSRDAARVLGRREVEFHADCANDAHLLTPGGEPWTLDQDAVNRALGLAPGGGGRDEDGIEVA